MQPLSHANDVCSQTNNHWTIYRCLRFGTGIKWHIRFTFCWHACFLVFGYHISDNLDYNDATVRMLGISHRLVHE